MHHQEGGEILTVTNEWRPVQIIQSSIPYLETFIKAKDIFTFFMGLDNKYRGADQERKTITALQQLKITFQGIFL